jgi:hypothetical protein
MTGEKAAVTGKFHTPPVMITGIHSRFILSGVKIVLYKVWIALSNR